MPGLVLIIAIVVAVHLYKKHKRKKEEAAGIVRQPTQKEQLKKLQKENLEKGAQLYQECVREGHGAAVNDRFGALHFNVAASTMREEERPMLLFCGDLRDATNTSKGTWAFILTNERLIYGQAGTLGNKFKSLAASAVTMVDYYPGAVTGRIEVKTLTTKFAVVMPKAMALNVYSKLDGGLLGIQTANEVLSDEALAAASKKSAPELIAEWAELRDAGKVTEEEYQQVKAEILKLHSREAMK